MVRTAAAFVRVLALIALSACSGARALPETATAPETPGEAQAWFVTDRAADRGSPETASYTTQRDPAMGFGLAQVDPRQRRARVSGVNERLRFPPTPLPFSHRDGVILPDRQAAAAYDAAREAMKADLAQALRQSGQGDVLLYVHGYNSDFEDTLGTLARVWAATDRTALPLAFSWPAGNPGAFGYFKDRESGEFSIFHLKQTLLLLREVPGLRRIHIVAHSRGSDVATTALREMIIAERAAGRNPRKSLKVENLILAAPDLDFSIVRQRLIAERFGPAFGRITVYINPQDGALGLAQVFLAGTRFGRLSYEQLGATEREIFDRIRNVHFINVSAVAGQSSHSYFRDNPEVLADMATVLTTGADPGDPRRNLIHAEANFWRLVLARDLREARIEADR